MQTTNAVSILQNEIYLPEYLGEFLVSLQVCRNLKIQIKIRRQYPNLISLYLKQLFVNTHYIRLSYNLFKL